MLAGLAALATTTSIVRSSGAAHHVQLEGVAGAVWSAPKRSLTWPALTGHGKRRSPFHDLYPPYLHGFRKAGIRRMFDKQMEHSVRVGVRGTRREPPAAGWHRPGLPVLHASHFTYHANAAGSRCWPPSAGTSGPGSGRPRRARPGVALLVIIDRLERGGWVAPRPRHLRPPPRHMKRFNPVGQPSVPSRGGTAERAVTRAADAGGASRSPSGSVTEQPARLTLRNGRWGRIGQSARLRGAADADGSGIRRADSAMWRGDKFVLHYVLQSAGSRLCSADQAIRRCLD
jgi:hypothetical protein